jgi:uncharacterized protein (TIGR03437 family)
MFLAGLAAAVLFGGVARAANPLYSADSIVNGANFAPGPLAPNSIATIFGTDLAWWQEGLTAENTAAGFLPNHLADVRVYVANYVAPLIYVCPTQINFLIPGNLRTGPVTVRVARQGVTGPEVSVTLVSAVPQFFQTQDGYVIAQHADYSLITPDHPALAGEIIVVYATGLGMTRPNPGTGEIPSYPGLMAALDQLRVSVAGDVLAPDRILYAGLTPGFAGLYQINLILPPTLGADPEIRAAVGDQAGPAGLKLATGLY